MLVSYKLKRTFSLKVHGSADLVYSHSFILKVGDFSHQARSSNSFFRAFLGFIFFLLFPVDVSYVGIEVILLGI